VVLATLLTFVIARCSIQVGLSFPDGRQGWASGEKGTIVRLTIGR
jgi:hypothetical protein